MIICPKNSGIGIDVKNARFESINIDHNPFCRRRRFFRFITTFLNSCLTHLRAKARNRIMLAAVMITLSIAGYMHAEDEPLKKGNRMNGPQAFLEASATDKIQSRRYDEGGYIDDCFGFFIDFHQNYISAADGDRCMMEPSCSIYCRRALNEYGAVRGSLLSMDRLIRCNGTLDPELPWVLIDGRIKNYDPVSGF